MRWLTRAEEAIARVEKYLAISALTIMVCVAFGQIVLRTFFSRGFLWADVLLRQLVLWVGFLGASLATRYDRHIDIDVITRLLRPRGQLLSGFLSNLIGCGVCLFLMYAAAGSVYNEYQLGEFLRALHLPFWVLQLILPFSFLMISIRFFLGAVRKGAQLISGAHRAKRRVGRS